MEFVKMHGAGNDFVVTGQLKELVSLPELAKAVCNRHTGVGADGLIEVVESEVADFKMRYFNADGSNTVCGNGMRCVGLYLVEQGLVPELQEKIYLEIHSGKRVEIKLFDGGRRSQVSMGSPIFSGLDIPVSDNGEYLEKTLEVNGQSVVVAAVGMGNPHCVIFVDNVDTAPVEELGPLLETHPFFPQKTNVEFAEIVDEETIKIRVWERGVGETLACGTGNCATLAAAVKRGYTTKSVSLYARGGEFELEWDENNNNILLTGPASRVFAGSLDVKDLELAKHSIENY